jgi:hypothetical protein
MGRPGKWMIRESGNPLQAFSPSSGGREGNFFYSIFPLFEKGGENEFFKDRSGG